MRRIKNAAIGVILAMKVKVIAIEIPNVRGTWFAEEIIVDQIFGGPLTAAKNDNLLFY